MVPPFFMPSLHAFLSSPDPALGEFELASVASSTAPCVGNGDDCAALLPSPGQQWLVSTDMLVEGRHFLSTVDPGMRSATRRWP
jgi:thiamine monophosphate kinase